MPSDLTQVSAEDLNTAARELNNTNMTLNSIQTALNLRLEPILIGGAWEGAANTRFVQVYDTYDRAIQSLYRSLDLLSQLINKSGGHYVANEDANHREIDLIDIPQGAITTALA